MPFNKRLLDTLKPTRKMLNDIDRHPTPIKCGTLRLSIGTLEPLYI